MLLGNGNGTFKASVAYPVGGNGVSIASADFNGDGQPDLVVENIAQGTVSILLNLGSGVFSGHVDYPAGSSPQVVTTGDFDNDGKVDLVVGNEGLVHLHYSSETETAPSNPPCPLGQA